MRVTLHYQSRDHSTRHVLSYWRSVITMYQTWTVIEIWSLKDIRVTFLTFCGHVTSYQSRDHSSPHVGFPIGGQCWPGVYLARLWRHAASKIMGSEPWFWGVMWRHRSRDHSTPHVGFAIGCQRSPCVYLERLMRYWASKILGSRPWFFGVTWRDRLTPPSGVSYRWSMVIRLSGTVIEIFSLENIGVTTLTSGVTWRHRSRDHSTPHGVFPIGGQWWPGVYLALLVRYKASK